MFLPAMEGGTFPFCVIRHEAIKEDSGTEITLYLKEDKDDENYSSISFCPFL